MEPDLSRRRPRGTPRVTLDEQRRRTGCTRGWMPWRQREEVDLREEVAAGWPVGRIARHHGRSRGAIRSRMERLGLPDSGATPGPAPSAGRHRDGQDAIRLAILRMEAQLAGLKRAIGLR